MLRVVCDTGAYLTGRRLGFSVVVYGLGSKKALLEDFRLSQLSQELHLVVNGFFPSITLKSVSGNARKILILAIRPQLL